MRKNVYQTNYDRLLKLGIITDAENVSLPEYCKSISSGYMDLCIDRLSYLDEVTGQPGIAFSMAHYFRQNGDACRDPSMVIVIYPSTKMAEAYSFQQDLPPIYQEVYPKPGHFYPRLRTELNSFLRTWLNNLIAQGHGKQWVDRNGNSLSAA